MFIMYFNYRNTCDMIFVNIQKPSSYIRKTARQVVLSRCYTANFAHIWGGGSIRTTLRIR